jgi:F-type H+-transporting ATPase subunit delta
MTNRTAANRYARALLDVAVKEKQDLHAIETQLAGFVELFKQHPTLEKVLLNPAVPAPRKRSAVAAVIAQTKLAPSLGKLLVLLAERDRLVLLPDLLASYRDRLLEHRNVVRAEVTTAAPLPAERAKAIERSLGQLTGRTVTIATRVDPAIIGGVVARIGSTVYDGSIATQLQKIKQRLIEGV